MHRFWVAVKFEIVQCDVALRSRNIIWSSVFGVVDEA
jgi:hypothetical protein